MAPRRQPPTGEKTSFWEEDKVLAFLESEKIKAVHAYTLWKWLINHPLVVDWSEVRSLNNLVKFCFVFPVNACRFMMCY